MRGNQVARMDDRGRFKVPRVFLKEILDKYGPEVYVTSINGRCAWVYPLPEWEELEKRLAMLPSMPEARSKFQRLVSYFGLSGHIDSQGRLLIHPLLRERGGFTGELAVLGQVGRLEVWPKDVIDEQIRVDGGMTQEELSALGI
jgi:MraZ protein